MSAFNNDYGVSETLGYILIFGIVLTGIAGIVLFGTALLDDAKDRNNFQNVEQGLTVVHSDLKRVAIEKAPVKTSKLHVEGGSLATNFSSSSFKVEINGAPQPLVYDEKIGSISYYSNTGSKTLSIENGGLWKSYDGDLMVIAPRIFASAPNKALVINVIRLTGEDSSMAGVGTTNLIMEYAENHVDTHLVDGHQVTITIETAYPNAWGRFFEESVGHEVGAGAGSAIGGFPLDGPPDINGNKVTVTINDVDQIILSEHVINIRHFIMTT